MIKTKKQAEDFIYRSYTKAEKYLDRNAPDSQKRSPQYTASVINRLEKAYGRPNILVTGSKGKGSAAVMLAKILQAHGKNTGLFTSPHITCFNERMRINDTLISDDELIDICSRLQPTVELIDSTIPQDKYISPIGIQTMAALMYFKRRTDMNIFECGKGARYDDVNNLSREYSLINTVFAEHTRELGADMTAIAKDKSYIIQKGQKCAYTARQTDKAMAVLEERAAKCDVCLKKYGRDFYCRNITLSQEGTAFDVVTKKAEYNGLLLPLLGIHQAENCALALAVCEDILSSLDASAVRRALAGVVWPGRLSVFSRRPLVIADACINRVSAERVKEVLDLTGIKNPVCIIGVPDDKDYAGVCDVIGTFAQKIILTKTNNPYYRFDGEQRKRILNAAYADNITAALAKAQKSGADVICVLGTTALIADLYSIEK